MSNEETARALGAESPMTVEIADKQCTVRPLSLRELTVVTRDCVERFRRSYVKTFADNLDLVPKNLRESMMRETLAEAARWDVDDLPPKFAYNFSKVEVTEALRKHIIEEFDIDLNSEEWKGLDEKEADKKYQRLTAASLDQEILSEKEYQNLTSKKIKKVKVPYTAWWITGNPEGIVTFIWVCFKLDGVTREQVEEAMADNPALLTETAQEIERLSSPQLGNG